MQRSYLSFIVFMMRGDNETVNVSVSCILEVIVENVQSCVNIVFEEEKFNAYARAKFYDYMCNTLKSN